jgi:HEAT repeat protein
MDKSAALQFLAAHQPMPSDWDITDEEGATYADIIEYFKEFPAPESIPLLIGSLGKGCGLGMYSHVRFALMKHPYNLVAKHLRDALENPGGTSREWCAELAVEFADPILLPTLLPLLQDEDASLRVWTAMALEFIADTSALPALEAALSRETEQDVQEQLRAAMAALRAQAGTRADNE